MERRHSAYRWHDNPRPYTRAHLYQGTNERPICNTPRATKGQALPNTPSYAGCCTTCRRWWEKVQKERP